MRKGIGAGPANDLLLGFGVCAMPPATPATLRSEEYLEGIARFWGGFWLAIWEGLCGQVGVGERRRGEGRVVSVAEKFEFAVWTGECTPAGTVGPRVSAVWE